MQNNTKQMKSHHTCSTKLFSELQTTMAMHTALSKINYQSHTIQEVH